MTSAFVELQDMTKIEAAVLSSVFGVHRWILVKLLVSLFFRRAQDDCKTVAHSMQTVTEGQTSSLQLPGGGMK